MLAQFDYRSFSNALRQRPKDQRQVPPLQCQGLEIQQRINTLAAILKRHQLDYIDEKECQRQIDEMLREQGATFEREVPMGSGYIDFYFRQSGLGLEVKANKNWSRREIFYQCEDYCKDERLAGLVLATGRAQGLPSSLYAKPVRVVYLGEAFL